MRKLPNIKWLNIGYDELLKLAYEKRKQGEDDKLWDLIYYDTAELKGDLLLLHKFYLDIYKDHEAYIVTEFFGRKTYWYLDISIKEDEKILNYTTDLNAYDMVMQNFSEATRGRLFGEYRRTAEQNLLKYIPDGYELYMNGIKVERMEDING